MQEFEKRYKALNTKQKEAVDTIDGPVMVVAGPGTGKTELLSVRVANILKKTDTLPENILCLTFTDSGAAAMRERLAGLLGPEAYKVAIHTFHSFGSDTINRYGQYFYNGAHFRPADELSSYELLSELLDKLPHDNPLASTLNDSYTYLRDIQGRISELKRGGLTPDELNEILQRNDSFLAWAKPKIAAVFQDRLSKKTIAGALKLAKDIASYADKPLELATYHALSRLVSESLANAAAQAETDNSTKPLSAWKKTWLEKDAHDMPVLKDEKRSEKLRALSGVYYDYLLAMQKAELYDYDDMILRVVHALEVFDELRFTLQEQYQYILVDEFQDTNDAQMRLIWNLTNNSASEGRPNLMIVGDDDQAIYRFQGAELSNILDFQERYREVAVITLTDNYRSTAPILDIARSVIVQADKRLETTMKNLSKILTPHHTPTRSAITATLHETTLEARAALARSIADDVQQQPHASRAVIARHHSELAELLPHLRAAGVTVIYEREDNALDSNPVRQLELAAHVIWHLSRSEFDAANEYLAEMLAHPAWGIPARSIWELSLKAYHDKKYWLEIMLDDSAQLQTIAEWCIVGMSLAKTEPLEVILDYLFGIGGQNNEFVSPYKAYFFGDTPDEAYLVHLQALRKIRDGIRDYRPNKSLTLDDFLDYIDAHRELNMRLPATTHTEATGAVTLLSAHKAKGLEFDHIYITDAQETVWGNGARSRSRLIAFPSNLPLSPAGDTNDERLRLLYVTLTRARAHLTISAAKANEQGKELLPVGSLSHVPFAEQATSSVVNNVHAAETDWSAALLDVPEKSQQELLGPLLEHYALSATHLNNFLDIRKGGPEFFLLHNLLRLPEAMAPSAAYGSAMHGALQRAHQHLTATGKKRPVEDILHDFEILLSHYPLSELDASKYATRGAIALTTFLEKRYDSFLPTQLVEQNFRSSRVMVGDVMLTGALDLIDIDEDEKTIFVTDYKTGKAARSWRGKSEFEKVKLHHYEQQLMLYKLLIENSRRFSGYTVTGARIEFVEPDPRNDIVLLDYTYDTETLAEFTKLITIVWQRIQALDFSIPHDYDTSLAGILNFERDLLL